MKLGRFNLRSNPEVLNSVNITPGTELVRAAGSQVVPNWEEVDGELVPPPTALVASKTMSVDASQQRRWSPNPKDDGIDPEAQEIAFMMGSRFDDEKY